jgi:hypothetical protein
MIKKETVSVVSLTDRDHYKFTIITKLLLEHKLMMLFPRLGGYDPSFCIMKGDGKLQLTSVKFGCKSVTSNMIQGFRDHIEGNSKKRPYLVAIKGKKSTKKHILEESDKYFIMEGGKALLKSEWKKIMKENRPIIPKVVYYNWGGHYTVDFLGTTVFKGNRMVVNPANRAIMEERARQLIIDTIQFFDDVNSVLVSLKAEKKS